jgi:hypothetical protein
MKTFIIKYYLTETAYRGGVPAFTETFRGDRNTAVNWAQNKVRTSNFKFYDIQEHKKKQTELVCFLTFYFKSLRVTA